MSRFGQLQRHEIQAKSHPGDVVTTADLEAENRLREGLSKLLPGSTVIGEEDAYRNPEILDRLSGDQPVWTVDPLDGTGNYAKGKPCFAMICALVQNGQTQMGWILDPVAGVCATAQRGKGAYLGEQKLTIAPQDDLCKMTGSLGDGIRKRINARKDDGEKGLPLHLVRYHCCGREYLDMLLGKIHFVLYGGRLMPWDHAAGDLMIAEAGGFGRMCHTKTPYDPTIQMEGKHLMFSPGENAFNALQQVLFNDSKVA